MSTSSIEWTDQTWNPVTGCTRASAGCDNCYAVTMTKRLAAMGQVKYQGLVDPGKNHFNGRIKCHEQALDIPRRRLKRTTWFVNSMSDLWHEGVPSEFIQQVFEVMADCPQHQFQVLTKRPERAAAMSPELSWPSNVWLGTSVEDGRVTDRIKHLQRTQAAIKFLSVEPLIGPIPRLALEGIDWVIVGGESGPKARPMDADWVRAIRDRCVDRDVAFFFKQWGKLANNPDAKDDTAKKNGGGAKGGRMLDGRTWDQMPAGRKFMAA